MEDFIQLLGKIENTEISLEIKSLLEQYEELKKETACLKEENQRLASLVKSKEAKRVLGFTLTKKKTGKDFRYENWYAFKRIKDQLCWVYLGKELKGAEEKIKAFCYQRGILLSAKAKKRKEKQETRETSTTQEIKKELMVKNPETKAEPERITIQSQEVGNSIALGQLILGFKVIPKTVRGIKQYQAYKRHEGKQCYVYICLEAKPITVKKAEEKIRQYCEKYKVL